jgi:hypothetical protein
MLKFSHKLSANLVLAMVLCLGSSNVTLAANIPDASDVILMYGTAASDQQTKYNFLFTVEGDNGIYACDGNRCSTSQWEEQGTITMTVYKLPDGFTRVSTIVDASVLQSYIAQAEQSYRVPNISTNLTATNAGRQYQTIRLEPNGQFTLETSAFAKTDITNLKTEQPATQSTQELLLTGKIMVSIITVVAGIGAVVLWKYYRLNK